ncbi:MAG TPA: transketolase C-terminal domain-containing protein [Candidatus Saccharimonadales bacterium]|nr:transketolase C-terminal domain-containing protein [Candidatus Saccharimonadales bacterium]
MSDLHLLQLDIRSKDLKQESIRDGFGRGLVTAGKQDDQIVVICADLTDSTKVSLFAEAFPDRFVEAGIAEQDITTVGSGMAAMGKKPFVTSYAAFCPGRTWEQIRTTICLNDQPVKIVGSHAGLYTSPDGATHQALEDITLMRVMPNMVVLVPCDSVESEKMASAMAADKRPNYVRLARGVSPILTTPDTPFAIGPAYVFREGADITLVATGTMTYQALVAADMLHKDGISAEVIHVPTIKPLDGKTILNSARKTGAVVVAEEGQINGGLGGAVAELLGEHLPTPMRRIGMKDEFGQSAQTPEELLKHYGLDAMHITLAAHDVLEHKSKT